MVHPFFDELRDPNARLPDSRHSSGSSKELPNLFDFSHHGKVFRLTLKYVALIIIPELSIAPHLNHQLVPPHVRPGLASKGLDIDNLHPLTKDQMIARLD